MKFYAAYFLLASLLQLATTDQQMPTISFISPEQVKNIGDTVDLQCTVQGATQFPVYWARERDMLPISMGPMLMTQDSRYSVKFDMPSSTFTLQIRDLQENDATKYLCKVVDSEKKMITAEVDLQVRSQPVIGGNSTDRVVRADRGASIQLQCFASGYPEPTISWRRENNATLPTGELIYEGNVLEISSISNEDRGAYFCVAENSVGRSTERRIDVSVSARTPLPCPPACGSQEFIRG